MGLQFYFGGAGAGKSSRLYKDMIEWSEREPERKILVIVPDQFTMQTQMDLVKAHPRRGILNIDVLSFGRLSHRIFEEVGGSGQPVLDDTGKSLVLRKVAANIRELLPVIGGNLHKQGYIHEVKSAISEFMQYGIGPQELARLTEYAGRRGALHYKLKDLNVLYQAFLDYIKGEFITTEETLDLLRASLEKSVLVRDSVVVFDGFTGFTPIQNRVIQKLMTLTERVIVTLTMGSEEDPFRYIKEQELFYLSKKTCRDMSKLAEEAGVKREEDVFLREQPAWRFVDNGEMGHLEKSLFRYPLSGYEGGSHRITLMEASTVAEEARQAVMKIKELTLEAGYRYRDIAVVSGNLSVYAPFIERAAVKYEIPVFMDQTRGILLNPLIEYIRSALKVIQKNFTQEAVFHYLRSGFSDFSADKIDRLENYCLRYGIKGRKKWSNLFTRRSKEADEKQLLLLAECNQIRETVMQQLAPLREKLSAADEMVKALYVFITENNIQQKLAVYEKQFTAAGDLVRAREYAQIYRLVMELLDQIYGLLGKDTMTWQEFADILDAGFGEIEVGTIPLNVDRVVVGDIERTRLNQVKVLFFLGINDGNIPAGSGKGGIISDLDREFLKESEFELAPTPRQQMYIQRLYLYLNMTKPSDYLMLSYAKINQEGKSLRPSYLVDVIRRLYPELPTERPERRPDFDQIVGEADSLDIFAVNLRQYAEGSGADEKALFALYQMYRQKEPFRKTAEELIAAAFVRYTERPLSGAVARLLYGSILENSVSRLERYAACAYAHFLQYGLTLKEREEYSFEPTDLGNLFHGVLEIFANKLAEHQYTWFDFPEQEGDLILREALDFYAADFGGTILFDSARNQHLIGRIYRVLRRTVRTLKQQLQKGAFVPEQFEVSFSRVENLESVNIALSEQEKMRLRGRIDRIDAYEDEDHIYIKVIDYKSGSRKFDLAALYYGLRLQLVVYMNVAMEMKQRERPDKTVVPAALLYYHVADPVVKEDGLLTPEEINQKLQQELRTTGMVNANDGIVNLLDREFAGKSLVIPVERKKDGGFAKRSSVITTEEFRMVSDYVNIKIKQFGREIMSGSVQISPWQQGTRQACDYCSYASVCGYDPRIPGYQSRKLASLSPEDVIGQMRRELEEEGGN